VARCADPVAPREHRKSTDFIALLAAALSDFYGLRLRGSTLIISRVHVADDHFSTGTPTGLIVKNGVRNLALLRLAMAAELPQIRLQIPRLGLVLDARKQFLCAWNCQFRIFDVVRKTASFQVNGQSLFASE
jgi:hypothetical protein